MRNFKDTKRIVIKIGTNTLSKGGSIDSAYVVDIAQQIHQLHKDEKQVVIVTSGAIGMGAGRLRFTKPVKEIRLRQACAAIGQPLLMSTYEEAFSRFSIPIAQVLVTAEVLSNRKTYLNLRNAMDTLLELNVIPILNENDSVSTKEIGTAFGDNDTLSALIASKIDADLLIMLSDIDALYTKDPRKFSDARPVPEVREITAEIQKGAGDSGSAFATGGMRTKIRAAKIVFDTGCKMVLAHGREKDIISRIMAGEQVGTLFLPRGKLPNKTRWILHSAPRGTITIDRGAMEAIRKHKSLLPSGIVSVAGLFEAGSVVWLNDTAKAVTNMSSDELLQITGKHSTEIRKVLGSGKKDVVATPENIVFLDLHAAPS